MAEWGRGAGLGQRAPCLQARQQAGGAVLLNCPRCTALGSSTGALLSVLQVAGKRVDSDSSLKDQARLPAVEENVSGAGRSWAGQGERRWAQRASWRAAACSALRRQLGTTTPVEPRCLAEQSCAGLGPKGQTPIRQGGGGGPREPSYSLTRIA